MSHSNFVLFIICNDSKENVPDKQWELHRRTTLPADAQGIQVRMPKWKDNEWIGMCRR